MSTGPRTEYIATVDPSLAPLVEAIAGEIEQSAPELVSRISYKMLTYVRGNDLRNWVVAVGTTKKGVQVRFLFGKYMDDPRNLLRHGTSTLSSIDYRSIEDFKPGIVAEYAAHAARRHQEFKARHAAESAAQA